MIGRKLGNRYEVIERIGGGGMAVVYRALDTLLNRNVSIKVLRAQFATDEDFVRRFRREAQAAASLSHPNVVNIYDVGVEGEDYYIVMEYIDGLTLKEVIQDRAPLPVGEAIDIAKQICAALGHAHENNIVHRDIKPHNILIGKDGRVKVTDFGIARAITSNTITQDGSVLGSVHYFSPEQARGGITDVKSDIYSLGVVLYEMVTGELPFSGETPISVALKHLQDTFMEPRQINPALPQSVENIILKALAKDPTVRYQTARDMYRDLEKAMLYPNVPKFTTPRFDEQQTIQMPAVGLRGNGQNVVVPSEHDDDVEEVEMKKAVAMKKNDKSPKQNTKQKKKRSFWKPVIWLLVIFVLLGVGAVTAYLLVSNYMGAKDVTMPNVVGESYDQAVTDLTKAGLDPANIHRQNQTDPTKKPNTVLSQDQYAGKTIKANREVTLGVATGPQQINLPNVVSMSKTDAIAALKQAGISDKNITVTQKEDANDAPDTVLAQTPTGNTQVDPNSQVALTVAKPVSKVTMPDLSGKTVDEAKNTLQQLGLTVGSIIPTAPDPGTNVPKGDVIRTVPYGANAQVDKGTSISLDVSTGTQSDSAERKTTAVTVAVPQGQSKVQVKIVKSDALGTNQVVVAADEITQQKTYNVDCVLKPDTIASIQVYLDGQLYKTIPVTYDNNTGSNTQ